MGLLRILAAAVVITGALSSCRSLKDYQRSYTLSVEDQHGRKAGVGVTIKPIDQHSGK